VNDRTMSMPWWREPIMWLVVGGPAAVVLAGVATAAIAIRGADPVIKADAAKPPAVQARNHAATPKERRAAPEFLDPPGGRVGPWPGPGGTQKVRP
jgi:hypothetical protein